jgi:DNA-binding GntR family transcriptional regulator
LPTTSSVAGQHQTFANLAERAIREMVLDGQLPSGVHINEVQLAAQLQISRGPLREALQRLASQGLVTTRSHRGAFATVIDIEELRNVYGLRIALERFAVRTAVTQPDAKQIEQLSGLLDRTRKMLAMENPDPYPVYGTLDFHRHLAAVCGNPAIVEVHERTLQRIALARSRSADIPERSREALKEHESVLRAITAGDEALAVSNLENHLRSSLRSAENALTAAGSPRRHGDVSAPRGRWHG